MTFRLSAGGPVNLPKRHSDPIYALAYQLINSPGWVHYSYSYSYSAGAGAGAGGHLFGLCPPGESRSYTVTVRATYSLGAYVDMSFPGNRVRMPFR